MIEGWLQHATEEFWKAQGGELPYPRSFQTEVSLAFPVTITSLPHLSITQVQTWLHRLNIPFRFPCQNRSLCGCIIATRGHGLIFLDSLDSNNEQRYTVAHEIAHFLLDYLYPRQRVLRLFGSSIQSVLDGERPPNQTERIDAVLSGISLTPYVDLMPRTPQGSLDQGYILRAEERADHLALELLAPLEQVAAQLVHLTNIPEEQRISVATQMLTAEYGLPPAVARPYSQRVLPPSQQGATARWFGIM